MSCDRKEIECRSGQQCSSTQFMMHLAEDASPQFKLNSVEPEAWILFCLFCAFPNFRASHHDFFLFGVKWYIKSYFLLFLWLSLFTKALQTNKIWISWTAHPIWRFIPMTFSSKHAYHQHWRSPCNADTPGLSLQHMSWLLPDDPIFPQLCSDLMLYIANNNAGYMLYALYEL